MLVAYDKNKNRIYASSEEKYEECFCPACGEALVHRKGTIKAPHFAHKPDTRCLHGRDKDSKSEWHIHMQELFPRESIEVRFTDGNTGEVHIADVYLEDSKTVIEFQHSPISTEEFFSRTMFHINEGRRIVWVFDESKEDLKYGRLRECEDKFLADWLHKDCLFDWPRAPRKMLSSIQLPNRIDRYNNYSICVYYGEADMVHRIIEHDSEYKGVTLSVHSINLSGDMNPDEFFYPEEYWLSRSPWKEIIDEAKRIEREKKAAIDAEISHQVWQKFHPAPRRRRPRL